MTGVMVRSCLIVFAAKGAKDRVQRGYLCGGKGMPLQDLFGIGSILADSITEADSI